MVLLEIFVGSLLSSLAMVKQSLCLPTFKVGSELPEFSTFLLRCAWSSLCREEVGERLDLGIALDV